ncbi:hypothetical protein CCAL13119_00475 [Campylobacter sp. RM13119]|uniref:hypothetical protein n=1 Tax=Campylobacter TaxID=194 RepID=UPI001473E77D|nr:MULTISPECIES: hypothetical protein [unclassified Campylobacter]MBE3022190.1 hypothetical protein [Campylobacter sp. 7477a]MBE3605434.1 hypothetical protein [Campylobacter sp. RM13119]MBE3609111.1 hypothetical protein [Campylobacter sp. RM12916]
MSVFLSNDVIAFLFAELIVIVLMAISQFYIVRILRYWDFNATTNLQYTLEKHNYLVNTILFFTIFCKIILFVFFALSLNKLSSVVPGAMCSAGVIGSNEYGNILFLLKLLLIFGLGLWLVVNYLDLKAINFPFLKRKYIIFSILFCAILGEFVLEILFFTNIPLSVPVFCCSVVFQAPKLPFGYTQAMLAMFFYVIFASIAVLNFLKQSMASFALNLLFLFIAYYAITYFFGLYVYEQPNHKCPYCMLMGEYYYIGYLIWGSLFLGIFYGITPFLVELITGYDYTHLLRLSSFWLLINVAICSFYVAKYYFTIGVLL